MPLFIVLNDGARLDESLKKQIKQHIRENCLPRHVPNGIYEIAEGSKNVKWQKA
ncbi:hypothetical protein [Tuberibacillus sp. Marseille-P3662]|uniref:hypothetical protein n=1 Tax=Tuberibacillus sp. Marseille-P3662 TaxID=1965358 RepID=UPI001594A53A|nr:hypothetical protein [Tuberibacillus sp. Marseille-P3662]